MSDATQARPREDAQRGSAGVGQRNPSERGGSGDAGEGKQGKKGTSVWEWVVAGISTLLVFGSVGFLLHEALTEPSSPPMIEIVADSVVDTGRGYVVEFRAHNRGHTTAARLVVEGQLKADTGVVETSQATIDYVPAEASRQGGLFFSADPRRHTLEIRPKGYDRP